MSRHFEGAHIDEIALQQAVSSYIGDLEGRIPTGAELRDHAALHGTDFATMYFYQALLANPKNKTFIESINHLPAAPDKSATDLSVIVVPGWLHRDHPEWGGDGKLIQSICNASHIDCDIIPTGNKNLILENARLIFDYLKGRGSQPTVLVSYSRSVLEIRAAIEQLGMDAFRHVRAWITISANVKGSRLVDFALGGAGRKIAARAVCATNRIPFTGVEEMLTTHPLWRQEFQVPEHIAAISIIGTPLGYHIPKYTLRNYRRLTSLGPNDGACLLSESYLSPGFIYPVWGADHFMRTPALSPLLYRLVSWCKSEFGTL